MTSRFVVADACVLFAWIDETDHDHATCSAELDQRWGSAFTTEPVLAEVHHLVHSRGLPVVKWERIAEKIRDSELFVTTNEKLVYRSLAIVDQYGDSGLDYADASVVAAAEHWDTPLVATLDNHFFAVRPMHVNYLEIVPAGKSNLSDRFDSGKPNHDIASN